MMELFISKRYLRGRKMGFISLITNISTGGVILGTMVLVIALSIANGMEKEVRDRIIGTFAHGRISKFHSRAINNPDSLRQIVQNHPKVVATSPVITGKGAIEHRNLQEGVMIMAVDEELEKQVTEVSKSMINGSFALDSLASFRKRDLPAIVIGTGLAHKFGVSEGAELVAMSLVAVEGEMDPIPKMMRFTVAGVFETGMYEYDQMLVFISLESGQKLFEVDGIEGVNFRCKDIYDAPEVARELVDKLGYPYKQSNWESDNRSLFQWMKLEKLIIFIVISLIIIVAAFNIASSLIMMIMEKRREIGILMNMGATRLNIMRIFVINGAMIGLKGSTIGTILGFTLSFIQQKYQLIPLPGDVYFINFIPILIRPLDLLFIFLACNVLCIIAAIYPAWQASKMLPADAVRLD